MQELQVLKNVQKFCGSDDYRVLRKVFYIPRHKKRTFFGEGYFIKDNVLWVRKYIASSILSSRINAKPFNCVNYRGNIFRFEEEWSRINLVGDSGLCVNIADTMTFVSITAYSLLAIADLADYTVDFIET